MKTSFKRDGTAARTAKTVTAVKVEKRKRAITVVRCNRCRATLRLKADGCLPIHKCFNGIWDCFSSLTQDFTKPAIAAPAPKTNAKL